MTTKRDRDEDGGDGDDVFASFELQLGKHKKAKAAAAAHTVKRRRVEDGNSFEPSFFNLFSLSNYLGDQDRVLHAAIKHSVHARLCRWQYLDFNALLQVFCDDVLRLHSAHERVDVLRTYFYSASDDDNARLTAALEFFVTLAGFRGFNATVKSKLSTIVTFITSAQAGLTTFSPTSYASASTPLARSTLSLSYMLPELISAAKARLGYDPGDQLTTCISESPELKSILDREDRRQAVEREIEETSAATGAAAFPPLSVVVNYVHGCIEINEGAGAGGVDTVDTFTVPVGMKVWVVQQATPACVNYSYVDVQSRLQKVYESLDVERRNQPLHVAAAMQQAAREARQEALRTLPLDRTFRVAYRQLMLEPRVVSLREGDNYINKRLSFSRAEAKTNSKSIWMMSNGLDMTPPVLSAQGVTFRFADVVNGARLRGAQNLLIVDMSCAAVCGTTSFSWLRRLFPARTCVALLHARLAGGVAKSRRRRRCSRSRSRRRTRSR